MFSTSPLLKISPEEQFQEHLQAGEKILWAGQPNPRIHFNSADRFLIPLSIWVFGFAIFWIIMATNMGAPIIFPIFGSIFLALGFYHLIGRFWYKKWRKRRTYYTLTNQRLMSIYMGRTHLFKELSIVRLNHLSKDVRNDGSGTIYFDKSDGGLFSHNPTIMQNTGLELLGYSSSALHFFDIDNVNQVYQTIQDVRNSLSP